MASTKQQHTKSEDQTGNDYLYFTHNTTQQDVLASAVVVDSGSDWEVMEQPLRVADFTTVFGTSDLTIVTNGVTQQGLSVKIEGGATTTLSDDAGLHADPSGGYVCSASFLRYYNGSGYDQVRGDKTDGMLVNLGSNNDVVVDSLPNGLLDSFGHIVAGSVQNQIDIQYYRSDGSVGDLVTETNANGGTATATGGMATFAATTTANSQAKGVTTGTTTYTAGAEIYAIFTAAFTGTGGGTSYHRIGLYDDNDGFFIGYEGATFVIGVRKGGVTTETQSSSFSEDDLTGGASSLFTRGGSPEALNPALINVWRIRFGWVGSAPIEFQVMAPDGHWVTFHKILQPNSDNEPSIAQADLPVTCDVNSGSSGSALSILTNCWAAGTTQSLSKVTADITDDTLVATGRSVITGVTTGGGGGYVNVKVSPAGALVADVGGSEVDVTNQPARDNATDTITSTLDTAAISDDGTLLTPKFVAINATTNGDNTIVSAVVGKKVRVLSYVLMADAEVGAAFEDGAGGTELSGQLPCAARGGAVGPFSPVGHFETTANTLLNLELDAAANVRGHLTYVEV